MSQLGKSLDSVVGAFGTRHRGLPTGIMELDESLNGLEKGDFVIVAGRPGMGKSAYAGTLALAAGLSHKVLFMSLEMHADRLIERFIASTARVNYSEMVQKKLSARHLIQQTKAVDQLRKYNICIDDDAYLSTDILRNKLDKQPDTELVIVDYLQLMMGARAEGRQQEISDTSRDLKLIAHEYNIPVVALCQLNRNCEYRDDPMPRASDLRESGSLEQDADKIILLHRPAYYDMQASHDSDDDDGEAKLVIGKNRHGPCKVVECCFMADMVAFIDKAEF